MQYDIRLHFAHAGLYLAVGIAASLITSTVIAARAYENRGEQDARQEQTITVKGSTRIPVVSDRAVWRVHVQGKGKTLPAAFEDLADGVQRVKRFLADEAFSEEEVELAAISTSTHYERDSKGRETNEVLEFTLSRQFTVTTGAVERVSRSAGRVTELIKEGVYVISGTPEYYYTKLPDLRVELMAAASEDARRRAERIAASTGCALGELRDARMGVLQVTEPNSTEVSSWGMYETHTIAKDVRGVVTATFGIARP